MKRNAMRRFAMHRRTTTEWKDAWIHACWDAVRVVHVAVGPARGPAPERVRVRAVVHLGVLTPADVCVDADGRRSARRAAVYAPPIRLHSAMSYRNGAYVFEAVVSTAVLDGVDAIEIRVRPTHDAARLRLKPVGRSVVLPPIFGRTDILPPEPKRHPVRQGSPAGRA